MDVRDFEFIERPDKAALENAIASLKSHGIIEPNNEKVLTPLGSLLTQLPVDIEVGKVVFEFMNDKFFNCDALLSEIKIFYYS